MTTCYEKSFSKLKLIKMYQKLIITKECFNDLALISIENDIVTKLNLNKTITNFADFKLRKKNF